MRTVKRIADWLIVVAGITSALGIIFALFAAGAILCP
jgi:hypothetical protein